MLSTKLKAMKDGATSAATRREANETKSVSLQPRIIAPNLTGTAPKYASLERLLRQMSEYSVLALPEETVLELYPLSEAAKTGTDPASALRQHLRRWREDMAFESLAVETLARD